MRRGRSKYETHSEEEVQAPSDGPLKGVASRKSLSSEGKRAQSQVKLKSVDGMRRRRRRHTVENTMRPGRDKGEKIVDTFRILQS